MPLFLCLQVHKGHKFFPQQFKVVTICEFCSRSIGLLENGEVCEGKHCTGTVVVVSYS